MINASFGSSEASKECGCFFRLCISFAARFRIIGALLKKALLQEGLASFEKIKKFTLLPREFSMENGELTNTLKIRRPVINRRYANEIEAMYA